MKAVLREQVLAKRNAISLSFIEQKSKRIIENLCNLPEIKCANTVLSYVSFGTEVCTHDLIKSLLRIKNIVVPIVSNKTIKQLSLSYLFDWSHLSPGVYGILEPPQRYVIPVRYKDIDISVVPGVAFDASGHRIGYGCGYFDRILKQLGTPKIGLAFDIQILDNIPHNHYDVSMDLIVTEKRIISDKGEKYC